MRRLSLRCTGVTLVETLAVVCIVAALATIALPSADPVSGFATEAIARELGHAVRFAQREAVRTGAYHTVKFDAAAQTIRLYRLAMPGSVAEDTSAANKVRHPVDKQEYRLALSSSAGAGVRIAQARFEFDKGAATNALTFDPSGLPVSVEGTGGADIKPLKSGMVRLEHGAHARPVQVAPVTGRVTF